LITLTKIISNIVEAKNRIVKVLGYGKTDIRNAKQVTPFGIDSNPLKDMIAVYSPTSNDSERVVLGYLSASELFAHAGEIRIFSTDANATEKAHVWCRNTGDINIGGTGSSDNPNHLVRWEDLNTQLVNLRQQINLDIIQTFNGHVHIIQNAVPVNPMLPVLADPVLGPMTDVTLDISSAKAQKLLIE
jgi:hypothetical protein